MRVLLVEDETRLADTIRRGLAAEGFVVDVEPTGTDGFWARRELLRRPRARHHAPGLNGYDVCRESAGPRSGPDPDADREGR